MSPARLLALSVAAVAAVVSIAWALTSQQGGASASSRELPVPTPAVQHTPLPAPRYEYQLSGPPAESIAAIKSGNLSYHLALLAAAAPTGEASGRPFTTGTPIDAFPLHLQGMIAARTMRLSDAGEIQVYALVDSTSSATLQALQSAGARIERIAEEQHIVQAQAPVAALRQIAALAGVRQVRLPDYAAGGIGSITSEGDSIIDAAAIRGASGLDGSGVTIGVIADGVGGLADSQASGDLPAVDIDTCNVVAGDPTASGAEGTAMLEIAHDIAPGADLIFGNFGFATALDFNAAVDCLADHADIVVDDISFFGLGPYDGSSFVSENTAAALNGTGPIRAYITSAGNWSDRHYQGAYVDSGSALDIGADSWRLHQFAPSVAPYRTLHAGLVSSPASFDRFRLRPGGTATIVVLWDDPWGTSANDYDLLFGSGGAARICSAERQDGAGGDDLPTEACTIRNNGTNIEDIDIMLGNFNRRAAPRTLDLFIICDNCEALPNRRLLDFNTVDSSVANQSDAGGDPASVIAVGGVRYQSPVTIETFSSRGPSDDGRMKPDVVAPSGVCVTGAGGFAPGALQCQGTGRRFFGTSAAAPHVAGVAALALQCSPGLDRQALRDTILAHAEDLGEAGPDNVFGYGLIDARTVIESLACVVPTPTRTPTATITPSPTATPHCIAGDVNHSGAANSVDAALVLQYSASLLASIACQADADVNRDAQIDSVDAALILQFDAGMIPQLPP